MSNTPELDANGNPITPGGEESVVLSKEQHAEMVERLANDAQSISNMTGELQELRKKNAELSKNQPAPTEVEKMVQAEFAKKEAETTKSNYERASSDFLDNHPEFSKENDPGGLKFSAFQKALSKMNLGSLKTQDEFTEALNDALGLMERHTSNTQPIHSSPRGGSAQIPVAPASAGLTPAQEKLVKSNFGGDVQKYLAAKAKRPAYFEELEKWA